MITTGHTNRNDDFNYLATFAKNKDILKEGTEKAYLKVNQNQELEITYNKNERSDVESIKKFFDAKIEKGNGVDKGKVSQGLQSIAKAALVARENASLPQRMVYYITHIGEGKTVDGDIQQLKQLLENLELSASGIIGKAKEGKVVEMTDSEIHEFSEKLSIAKDMIETTHSSKTFKDDFDFMFKRMEGAIDKDSTLTRSQKQDAHLLLMKSLHYMLNQASVGDEKDPRVGVRNDLEKKIESVELNVKEQLYSSNDDLQTKYNKATKTPVFTAGIGSERLSFPIEQKEYLRSFVIAIKQDPALKYVVMDNDEKNCFIDLNKAQQAALQKLLSEQ